MRTFQEVLRRDEQSGPPAAALAKIETMREARDAARAKCRALSSRVQDALKIRGGIEREKGELTSEFALGHLRHHDADGRGGRTLGSGRKTLEEIGQALALQNAEIDELRSKETAAKEAAAAISAPLQTAEAWLAARGGVALLPFTGAVKPRRKSGEGWADAVSRIRGESEDLQAELRRVASAPISAAAAKAAMRREVDALAEAGAPDVTGCLGRGGVRWPTRALKRTDGVLISRGVLDAHALLAWLNRDQLIARLEAEIDAAADPEGALTDDQRRKEGARLRAELLKLEREEEAAITAAEAESTFVPRRRDADPRAVLGLADREEDI